MLAVSVAVDVRPAAAGLAPGAQLSRAPFFGVSQLSPDVASYIFLCLLFFTFPASAATNLLPATISSSTTLSGTNLVAGTVTVESNAVLTIQPGTVMLMSNAARLVINGQLLSVGTSNQPILFTRATSTARWKQVRFNRAQTSRLAHTLFEFADCAGTHLDYYDNDCNTNTAPPARNYHEALVAIATRLELDNCTFQNFPDGGSSAEGDALAIISDDPQQPGPASAWINRCRFVGIGQGIHSRFSPLLVENCYFTGHHGDNDDIDMYGESVPPPLIRSNVFLNPAHDDMINPTRCSAIIIGNLIAGGDDHGIVLRDKCYPIVMNNVISNIAAGGISIQNQCEALLINNTIVNCGRGLRLFDHTDRWVPPYCLFPGSGKAILLNSIIWDCPISMDLQEAGYTNDLGSHVQVYHSLIQGGQASARVSTSSTLLWGPGIITNNPNFLAGLTLASNSPAIDVGVIPSVFLTNLSLVLTNDFAGMPRPLDSNGDGQSQFDLGAFEFLLPSADSNGDGIPDGWTLAYGLNPTQSGLGDLDSDGDGLNNRQEYIAATSPVDSQSVVRVSAWTEATPAALSISSATNRVYTLWASTNLLGSWNQVSAAIAGTGGSLNLVDTNPPPTAAFYRVGVRLP